MSNTGLLTLKVIMIIYVEIPEEWSCVTSLRSSMTHLTKVFTIKYLIQSLPDTKSSLGSWWTSSDLVGRSNKRSQRFQSNADRLELSLFVLDQTDQGDLLSSKSLLLSYQSSSSLPSLLMFTLCHRFTFFQEILVKTFLFQPWMALVASQRKS